MGEGGSFLPPVVAELRASIGEFTAKMGEAKAEMSSVEGHSKAAFGTAASVGKAALMGIAGGAAAVGLISLKMAGDFQESMTELVTGAGESEANIKLVGNGILKMAGQVGTSAKELSDGMFLIESAGYHGAAGLKVLQVASEGARVGGAQMADVANAVTSALNAYHHPATDAAAVMNTLTATVANGKMHMQDLATSLATVMPSAAALHIPLEQIGGALATMTGQGTGAAQAATYLRFVLMALANPTAKARKEMEAMGITSVQVADVMTKQGLPQALQFITDAITKKFKPGSSEYTAALANMVGGTRGMQAALELTGEHMGKLQENIAAVTDKVREGGSSVVGWAEVQKDFNFKLDQAKETAQALGIQLGLWLIPKVEEATRAGLAAVAWMKDHKAISEALGVAIGTVLVTAIGAYIVSMATAAVATLAATWPILAIIAAVALVGVAIFELATHWKQIWADIKQWVADGYQFVHSHLLLFAIVLGPAGPLLLAAVFLIDHWRAIWSGIHTAVADAWAVIQPIFHAIQTAVEDVINAIAKVGNAAGNIPGAGVIGKIGGFIGKIPGFAAGGIVMSPTLAMIGEAGPEVVLPLTNASRMAEIFGQIGAAVPQAAVLSGATGGSAFPISSTGGGAAVVINQTLTINASGTSREIVAEINRAVEHNNAELVRTFRSYPTR